MRKTEQNKLEALHNNTSKKLREHFLKTCKFYDHVNPYLQVAKHCKLLFSESSAWASGVPGPATLC